jgi:hypothetical protein|uniref:hypothetical protein n=1 Tax=Eubacterium sp. TaxID=142586 RepID=UPI003FEDD992
MTLKELLGDKFKDGLTVTEIETALKDVSLGVSPEKLKTDYVSKELFDKSTAETSAWKKKFRDTLDDATRKAEEAKDAQTALQTELDTLRKEKLISTYTAEFLSAGYSEELAKSTAKAQADGDTATFFKNLKTHEQNVKAALKDKQQKDTSMPPVGGGKNTTPDTQTGTMLDRVQSIISDSMED